MSRENDWHVFDRACDITAMALKGSAGDGLDPAKAADVFREVFKALREAALELEGAGQKAGF
jgi:hypothetical protein